MMTIARGVIVAWFCFHVEIVRAAVLFSTFGTGTGYDSTNGLNIDGPLSPFPQAIAEPFVPMVSASLDSVEVAISNTLGMSELNIRVYSDLAGRPGALLEESSVAGFSQGIVTANFSGQLRVDPSTPYWLGLFTAGNGQQIWHDSTSGATAIQASSDDNGMSWITSSSEPFSRAAFSLQGTPLPQSDTILIAEQSAWRYFPGLAEPSLGTNWTEPEFVDDAWDFGVEGFGYDIDPATQDSLMGFVHTPLLGMHEDGTHPDPYTSLYLRRGFSVQDPATVSELILQIDYDDSFIAYINGTEVMRSAVGMPGIAEPFDALGNDHESTNGNSATPLPRFTINVADDFPGLLQRGSDNVLAIQGLNAALDDPDFVLSRISLEGNLARGIVGDFNLDHAINGIDIDELVSIIVSGTDSPTFDLNGDLAVNEVDVASWLLIAGRHNQISGTSYLYGDANLDGLVDGSDFNAWNAGRFSDSHRWTRGNFNADQQVDAADLQIWNANKFTSSGSQVRPVPEPRGGMPLILLAACAMLSIIRALPRQQLTPSQRTNRG